MRLLDTKTGKFRSFEDPREVRYAVLSHVWVKHPQKEMTYQEVQNLSSEPDWKDAPINHPSFPKKIRSFCEAARDLGFEFGWADSCCIDKTSSSELSESITSMYDWYQHSDICLAYLHDVEVGQDEDLAKRTQALCGSQWFQRGWTLQELLAPSILLFFSQTWKMIGSKQASATHIASVTKIDRSVLTFEQSLDEVSVACRMSWAASRSTTREEDEAYCLMGVFGVSIPVIYGEGRYAFVRLQEEIIRTIPDQSIFAWGHVLHQAPEDPYQFQSPCDPAVASTPNLPRSVSHLVNPNPYLLASSPMDFLNSSRIIHFPPNEFARRLAILAPESTYQVFTATAYGIHVCLPLVAIVAEDHDHDFPRCLAILACGERRLGDDGNLLALLLHPQAEHSGSRFTVGAIVGNPGISQPGSDLQNTRHYRTAYLSSQDVRRSRNFVQMVNIYLPHRPLRATSETERDPRNFRILRDPQEDKHFEICLSGWSQTLLSLAYGDKLEGGGKLNITSNFRLNLHLDPWITIESQGVPIKIQVGYCKCTGTSRLGSRTVGILGVLVWSDSESDPPADAESSLKQQFKEDIHFPDHPVHLDSWTFHGGIASTTVKMRLKRVSSSSQGLITVRLTLNYHSISTPAGLGPESRASSTTLYELGVEVTSPSTGPDPVLPPKKRMRRDSTSVSVKDDRDSSYDETIVSTPHGLGQARASTPSRAPLASYKSSPGKNPPTVSRGGTNTPPVTPANLRTNNGAITGRDSYTIIGSQVHPPLEFPTFGLPSDSSTMNISQPPQGWHRSFEDRVDRRTEILGGARTRQGPGSNYQLHLGVSSDFPPTQSQTPFDGFSAHTKENFEDFDPGTASGSEASPGQRLRDTDRGHGPNSSFGARSISRCQDTRRVVQTKAEGPTVSTADFWQQPGQAVASSNGYPISFGRQLPSAQGTAPDLVSQQYTSGYDTASSLQAPVGDSGVFSMNRGGSRNGYRQDEDASHPTPDDDAVRDPPGTQTSQLEAVSRIVTVPPQSIGSATTKPGVTATHAAGQGEQRSRDEMQIEKNPQGRWFKLKPSEWFKPFKRNSTKTSAA